MTSALPSQMAVPDIAPSTLLHADIARRIPHQHSMCLLDRVTAWDPQQICCETDSHRSQHNPMRAHGRLGSACGIEYAAQAMAVHGALIAESRGLPSPADGANARSHKARGGYLVSVRGVTLFNVQLDTVAGQLTVTAERVSGDANTVLYSFAVLDGPRTLLSGRAIVVLDPPNLVTGAVAARVTA
jgi:predicted hotdog family 3-hydroxylacyl-ACP dehydratase